MGAARRRKQSPPWKTQLVLCYEQEPYIAFDVTASLVEQAIASDNPPMTNNEAVQEWLIASLNQLREDVALVRDHSDELMSEPGRRDTMTCKAITVVQFLLTGQQKRMASYGAVLFNLKASQSTFEDRAPAFQISCLAEPLSAVDIRAMSTAKHLYSRIGDTCEEIIPQHSKTRSKDRTCVSIQAFWHNDQPGGLMLEAKINVAAGQDNLNTEMELLDQLVVKFGETRPSAADCDTILHRMAQHPQRDTTTSFLIMASIAYAEEAGYLESNEFNGMVYVYRLDEDEFYIDRKDRPS